MVLQLGTTYTETPLRDLMCCLSNHYRHNETMFLCRSEHLQELLPLATVGRLPHSSDAVRLNAIKFETMQ